MWRRSKAELLMWLLKGKRFCLAKGQILQVLLQEFCKKGKTWDKSCSLESEGWPNLKCQRDERVLLEATVAENELKA